MKKLLAGAALAVVAFAATPAAAQSVQGFRVEGHLGADISRVKVPGLNSPTVKINDTGLLYGVGAGYDFAVSNAFSLGLDLDLDRSTAKLEKTFLDGIGSGVNAELQIKPRWDGFVGARASFPVSDVSNFYLKAGYARAGYTARLRAVDVNGASPVVLDSESTRDHVGGWRVAGGAQVAIMHSAYLGGEVRYTDYKHSFSRVQALLTLGMRFGAPVVVEPVPVAAPLPAPEPAPATQTCADGSVILATDMCPAPAAPPAPAPAPERG